MKSDILKKYSELIVKTGLNLQKDQCLNINCAVDQYDFALSVAETAYELGSRYVDINITGSKLTKVRVGHSNKSDLSFVPNFKTVKSIEHVADDWANLTIDSTEEIDLLADADISSLDTISRSERAAVKLLSQQLITFNKKWCIVAVPGPKWANKIYGTNDSEKNLEKLNSAIIKILRLDSENPAEVWKVHGDELRQRANKLSAMKLDKIHFTGGGTDLMIGLIPGSSWKGGLNATKEGSEFIPNLPTEEVFTTPDYSRTNGIAKVTRPVKVLEKTVEGAWFEFKDGKVINYGADSNKEALDKFLTVDEGASYLGESALVDSSSPIFESGLVFNSILYDENAACHIAIGKGFSSLVPGGNKVTSESDIKALKCNVSLVHTDFMIGHKSINVTGTDKSNKQIEIIKDGKFTI